MCFKQEIVTFIQIKFFVLLWNRNKPIDKAVKIHSYFLLFFNILLFLYWFFKCDYSICDTQTCDNLFLNQMTFTLMWTDISYRTCFTCFLNFISWHKYLKIMTFTSFQSKLMHILRISSYCATVIILWGLLYFFKAVIFQDFHVLRLLYSFFFIIG